MSRMIFILGISLGSIAVGYLSKRLVAKRSSEPRDGLSSISRRLKLIAFFFLNPLVLISTFWELKILDFRLILLPVMGVLSILLGMLGALAAIRIMNIPPFQAGSTFTCGAFSNILTIGGLVAYTLFREPGYALIQLFTIAMSPVYYLLGFPISANVGHGRRPVYRVGWASFKENPYLVIPLLAIGVGFAVKATGITRPAVFAGFITVIIPFVAAMLGVAIGFTLRFTAFVLYAREITVIVAIRHLLVPACMIPLAVALGFGGVSEGLALKVIIISSVMPVAFSALVPPAIYGFDLDLANSAWMASTVLLAVIVPALFLLFRTI